MTKWVAGLRLSATGLILAQLVLLLILGMFIDVLLFLAVPGLPIWLPARSGRLGMELATIPPVPRQGNVEKIHREADGTVQSLLRALNLLELLAGDDEGYRLIDLAERAGLPSSTTHRLLTTLQQRRFVHFDGEANLWHVGVQCFAVGAAFGRRRNFTALALPILRRLRDATGETVNLGLADQGDMVFLTQVESREPMRAMGKPGARTALACTAMGQAILAAMPGQGVSEYLQNYGMPRLTPNSIARPTKLREALAEARRTGYAVDDEENAVGLRCVAAVIHDEHRRPTAAISLAGPTLRVTLQRLPELGGQVIAAAREITDAIGGRPPAPVAQTSGR